MNEDERYALICGPQLKEIAGKVAQIHTALFIDNNGRAPFMVRLDRIEQVVKMLAWSVTLIVGSAAGAAIAFWVNAGLKRMAG